MADPASAQAPPRIAIAPPQIPLANLAHKSSTPVPAPAPPVHAIAPSLVATRVSAPVRTSAPVRISAPVRVSAAVRTSATPARGFTPVRASATPARAFTPVRTSATPAHTVINARVLASDTPADDLPAENLNQHIEPIDENVPPVPHAAPGLRVNPAQTSQHHRIPSSDIQPPGPPQVTMARIPPVISDRLASLENKINLLQTELDESLAKQRGMNKQLTQFSSCLAIISKRADQLEDDREHLQRTVDEHEKTIESLTEKFSTLSTDGDALTIVNKRSNNSRDNSLNVCPIIFHE
jgi:hypothetical protein